MEADTNAGHRCIYKERRDDLKMNKGLCLSTALFVLLLEFVVYCPRINFRIGVAGR